MSALPANFPQSTTAEGALIELLEAITTSQAIAIAANSQISRVVDSYRPDLISGLLTFGGALPIDGVLNAQGKVEIVPVIKF